MDREAKKYPSMFSVFVPKLDPNGSIKHGENKEVIMAEEFGELTCWHIVHCDSWKKDLSTKTALAHISEESRESIHTDGEEEETSEKVATNKKKRTNRRR